MGGKGYKPRKDYAGRTVSGDWEDSDRGSGNKATRRAGGEVEAKSPTYIAHVVNKGKKKVDPKKNPVVGEEKEVVSEIAGTVAKQGGKALLKNQLKRKVVRQGIKVAGKTGGRAAQGGISGGMKGTLSAIKDKKAGKGEKIGKVVGGLTGGIAGGAAGVPLGGVGAIATGVAGGEVGERIGGAIGKKFDKKKPTPAQKSVKTESYASPKTVAEKQKRAKLDALLKRMEDKKTQAKKVTEAKVDAGLSPEEKEKVRNVRKFGVSHNVAGHGKLRRSLAKMNRGDKKIPGDKSKWMEMESLQVDENRMAAYTAGAGEGSPASRPTVSKKLADKVSRSSDERAFGNRKKKEGIRLSPTKKYSGKDKGKVVKRANTTGRGTPVQYRKSHEDPDMGRYQQKVTQGSGSVKDIKSSFSNWRNDLLSEEGYDRMRDDRLVKYGIGHDGSDRRGSTSRPTGKQPKGKTVLQRQSEKEHGKDATALDIVKKNIEKEHGKGAIYDGKKK